jgi:glucose/arabinose dehydrogenase
VLLQPHPTFTNHNGGEVMIGRDNLLYIGFGDGGGAGDPFNNAQNLKTLAGKIVRIDPRPTATAAYRIPPANPFATRVGVRHEILMYGLRNPWRFSLDRANNDMWIGDVGQDLYEEIDYALAGHRGINYGWNKREGFHPYNGGAQPPGAHNPLLERPHSAGDCAIVGGYVYRLNLIPNLTGAYLYGDFCTGEIRAMVQVSGTVTQSRDLGLNVSQLTSFGEGPYGGLYAASRGGTIYSIANN